MKTFNKALVPLPKLGPCVPLDKFKPPFDLEIGCGTGDFAIQWAKKTKNPVIAIEKTQTRFLKFEQKCKELGKLKNLWPVHTNAVWWLVHYGKKNMFENIFLLYPNPYPKKKQSHLRWINRPFIIFLLNILQKKGRLELRTNKKCYYEEFRDGMKSFSFMNLNKNQKISNPSKAQTLFEKKYLKRGELCYLLEYQKL